MRSAATGGEREREGGVKGKDGKVRGVKGKGCEGKGW